MEYDEKPKKPYSYFLKWRSEWIKEDQANNNDPTTINERVKEAWLNIEESEKIHM